MWWLNGCRMHPHRAHAANVTTASQTCIHTLTNTHIHTQVAEQFATPPMTTAVAVTAPPHRISASPCAATIAGMSAGDTADYIGHHCKITGRPDTLFSYAAIGLIHNASRRHPRAVNNPALQALTAAFAADHASSTRKPPVLPSPKSQRTEPDPRRLDHHIVNAKTTASPRPGVPRAVLSWPDIGSAHLHRDCMRWLRNSLAPCRFGVVCRIPLRQLSWWIMRAAALILQQPQPPAGSRLCFRGGMGPRGAGRLRQASRNRLGRAGTTAGARPAPAGRR